MPQFERGILGVRKDKKKQILFSFATKRGAEEWPSDDSEDSDYNPYDGKNEDTSTKKTLPKKVKKERKCKSEKRSRENTVQLKGNPWGSKIPPEVLLKIFTYVVQSIGALPFLPRASRVCQLWNDTATELSLWQDVDLSYGWVKKESLKLRWLCENRLNKVNKLNLTGWGSVVTDEILQHISRCKHLEELNVQGCMKIKFDGLNKVLDACQKLHTLDLSQSAAGQNSGRCFKTDIVTSKNLCSIVDKLGSRLQSLNLSQHTLSGFNTVLKHIMKNCKMLTKLELNNAQTGDLVLDIETFQKGCPRLKVLDLNNTHFRCTAEQDAENNPGFADLRELRVCCKSSEICSQGISDEMLHRILCTSVDLELLDIRCCNMITPTYLSTLCCSNISHLYLTWTRVTNSPDICWVFSKWNHSLVELEIDRCLCYCEEFPSTLPRLGHHFSKLETINLASSNINMTSLKELLYGCQQLKTVDLSSCRSLDAGFKRKYTDLEDVQKLRKRLESH